MAKKPKKSKTPKNPWTGRTWHLMTVSGPATPLLAPGNDDGKKNRFRLVVGSTSGKPKRINSYKVKGAMTKYWNDLVFVPRGKEPLALQQRDGTPIPPPGAAASPATIQTISGQLVTAIDNNARIRTSRLECDVTLPDVQVDGSVSSSKKQFGMLRLFQVPKALGSEALLVVDFAFDIGLPGGSGGGGSDTDKP
jgi:hypothetical protein